MKLFLALCLILSTCFAADAATYYIATTGNDTTGNGSSGTPWRTLNKAGNTVTAGDTVIMKNGTYLDANANTATDEWYGAGNSGAWITVQAETAGSVIIDGNSNADDYALLIYSTAQYTRFEGIVFTGSKNSGVHMNPASVTEMEHIYFYQCTFHDIARSQFNDGYGRVGIYTGSYTRNTTADRCLFYNIGRIPGGSTTQDPYHDYVHDHNWYMQGAGHVVKNCIFYNVYGGWALKIDGHIGAYTGATHTIVNNTFAHAVNTFDDNDIAYHGGHITIYNNYTGYGGAVQTAPHDVIIENNASFNPPVSTNGAGGRDNFFIQLYNMPTVGVLTTLEIDNNVTNADRLVYFPPGYTSANCESYSGNVDGTTAAILDHATMGMTNPASGTDDFTLTADATYLIDEGSSTNAPSYDFAGLTRPQGLAYDVGAYENDFTSPTPSNWGPSGAQACNANPKSVLISGNTDETANARIGTTDEGDYDSMPSDSMDTTNGTSHMLTASLACGASYTYYVYFEDPSGNEAGPTTVSFSIDSGEYPDPLPGVVGMSVGVTFSGAVMQ